MSLDENLVEAYFDWLKMDAFESAPERARYDGVCRVLHDIPFYWVIWSDENRVGDALAFRQYEFLDAQVDIDRMDPIQLGHWATATPSVLEVLLGMARRWSLYFEGSVAFYFGHMFRNMTFDNYKWVVESQQAEEIRILADGWMSRQFEMNGIGSPFPLRGALPLLDMRKMDIWMQMNAYSAEHFQ